MTEEKVEKKSAEVVALEKKLAALTEQLGQANDQITKFKAEACGAADCVRHAIERLVSAEVPAELRPIKEGCLSQLQTMLVALAKK